MDIQKQNTENKTLTGHIQQVFQGFDCPRWPKLIFYFHQGTAITKINQTPMTSISA